MTSESSDGENEDWSSKSDSGSDIASSRNKRGKLLGKMRDKFRQGSRKGIHLIVYWVFATFQHYFTIRYVSIGIITDLDLLGTSAVHKSTKGTAGIPGMPNENYIRKR